MEKALTMAKTKSKSVIIDGDLHYKFKVFCRGKNYKIGGAIQSLIEIYMDNYDVVQKMINEK